MKLNMMPTVNRFARKNIKLKRKAAGSYVNGRWVDGAAQTDIIIKAVIQPSNPQDLQVLPEGERRKQIVSIWTGTELKAAGDDDNIVSDVIEDGSRKYKVMHIFDRQENGYHKALAEYLP